LLEKAAVQPIKPVGEIVAKSFAPALLACIIGILQPLLSTGHCSINFVLYLLFGILSLFGLSCLGGSHRGRCSASLHAATGDKQNHY